ncbi:MAG: hypothetical protein HRT94_05435 [Alphaproteobacteria bacterium]|nr:hypothetical protein [Alphaproteobacteria bacterium]
MADIFQEVDEALKQEKLEKFWDEYKNTIVTAIVVLIASTALSSFYQSWDKGRDHAETAALLQAVEADDQAAAFAEFADKTRRGHETIAKMNQAAVLIQKGTEESKKEAAEIYAAIAMQKSAPDDFRDLSRVLAVRNGITGDQAEKLLKPILKNDDSPFHWHARLEAATYYAHQGNGTEKAIEVLEPFTANPLVPDSLKQTAEALLYIYQQKEQG